MNIYTLFCIFMQDVCAPVCSLPVFFETKGAKIIIWVVNIYDVTHALPSGAQSYLTPNVCNGLAGNPTIYLCIFILFNNKT